jgi:hypothetical protein
MKRLTLLPIWFLMAMCTGTNSLAALMISQSVFFDAGSGVANFVLVFDCTPNFFTVGPNSPIERQADSFQFWINPSTLPLPPYPYGKVVIRGDEIHVSGDLRIRDVAPSSSDPVEEGWCPIRGSVPISISGESVSFSVPMDLLGVTGAFSYHLEGYNYGSENYSAEGTTVPDSSSKGITLVLSLGLMLGMNLLQKQRSIVRFSFS